MGLVVPPEWSRPGTRPGRPASRLLPEDLLRRAVLASFSATGVARELGCTPTPAVLASVRHSIEIHGVDTSHFGTPGRRPGSDARVLFGKLRPGRRHNSHKLGRRLVELGLKPRRCERCGRSSWEHAPIPLELDHANGVRTDNRYRNLRLLCPNCHALTPTYRGRNIGRAQPETRQTSGPTMCLPSEQLRLWS